MASPKIIEFVQGSTVALVLGFQHQVSGLPVDITLATEIKVGVLKTDGTVLEKKLSTLGVVIVSGPGGVINAELSPSETLLVNASDELQDIEAELTIPTGTFRVQYIRSLLVHAQLIPLA
jgi:hypothetical protein